MSDMQVIGMGALIRIPSPLRPSERQLHGVGIGRFSFEQTEMGEWLEDRQVDYRLVTSQKLHEFQDTYYVFIANRTQAIAFVAQFGNETEHRTWYEDAPDYSDDGIPIGWKIND
jgi:hypothetical protein